MVLMVPMVSGVLMILMVNDDSDGSDGFVGSDGSNISIIFCFRKTARHCIWQSIKITMTWPSLYWTFIPIWTLEIMLIFKIN